VVDEEEEECNHVGKIAPIVPEIRRIPRTEPFQSFDPFNSS
jgi:hypothetical protein